MPRLNDSNRIQFTGIGNEFILSFLEANNIDAANVLNGSCIEADHLNRIIIYTEILRDADGKVILDVNEGLVTRRTSKPLTAPLRF